MSLCHDIRTVFFTGLSVDEVGKTWERIKMQFPDVDARVEDFQFPGRGQRFTPVADTSTLVEIAWLCPGKAAKEFRRKGAVTLCRALGGDLTLVDEIEARHRTIAGTDEQRTILAGTGVTPSDANRTALVPASVLGKRKAEELELARMDGEIRELKFRALESHVRSADLIRGALSRYGVLDAATEQFLGSNLKTELLLLGDGQQQGPSAEEAAVLWPVVNRTQKLGFRLKPGQDAALGKRVRKAYEDRYGKAPGKKTIFHKDTGREVFAYTETECREVVDDVVRAFFA